VTRTAAMIGQWMAVGFVHGVMNTDNFNITGESFDYGPWRFLEASDPNFTAAYFDHQGLYRFGRQPTQGLWALQQLGGALSLLADADALSAGLSAYTPAYQAAFAGHTLALLGVTPAAELQQDLRFLQAWYGWMTETRADWAQTFFDWFGGAASADRARRSPQAGLYDDTAFADLRAELTARDPVRPERLDAAYFQAERPVSLVHEAVEAVWAPIADQDDWSPLQDLLDRIEQARRAYDLPEG